MARVQETQDRPGVHWEAIGLLEKPVTVQRDDAAKKVTLARVHMSRADQGDPPAGSAFSQVCGVASPGCELRHLWIRASLDAANAAILDGMREGEPVALVLEVSNAAVDWREGDNSCGAQCPAGTERVPMRLVSISSAQALEQPIHPFQPCERRWLVDPERHSEIAKIARELALSRTSRLLLEGSSIEQWGEAALEIECLLRLLRSSVHRPIRDPSDERRHAHLWDLAGSEIRERLASLSQQDREYVVKNGDRFWPDLPNPQQAEFINYPQLLDELAHAYLKEGPGASRTLEWNLVIVGLMAGERSIRAELTRGGLDPSATRALLSVGGHSIAIGGVLGWFTSSAMVFVLVAASIAASDYVGLRRRRRALEGFNERLDKIGRALAQLHSLSDDDAFDGFEYRAALSAITQPASFLPPFITRSRSDKAPSGSRTGRAQKAACSREAIALEARRKVVQGKSGRSSTGVIRTDDERPHDGHPGT